MVSKTSRPEFYWYQTVTRKPEIVEILGTGKTYLTNWNEDISVVSQIPIPFETSQDHDAALLVYDKRLPAEYHSS